MKSYVTLIVVLLLTCSSFGGPLYAEEAAPPPHKEASEETKPSTFPFEEIKKGGKDQDEDRFFYEFLNMLATLGLLVGVLLAASWLVKRMMNTRIQQMNVTSLVKIVERRSLSPKTAIYLLEIQGKTLVVGETPAGLARLAEFDFAIPEAKE